MQASDGEVDDDPIEEHHCAANDRKNGRPGTLILRLNPHMDQDGQNDKCLEREDFFGIPAPRPTPRMIRPDGAHHQTSPKQNE